MHEQLVIKNLDTDIRFPNTTSDYPTELTFHELFEEQVVNTPNNSAVVFNGTKLTYFELNKKSNQLARLLRSKGVGPEKIVGLLVSDNTIEMVIGMIGVLKAGGAFLPIDSSFPKDRIEFIINDSDAVLLLTQGESKEINSLGIECINLENQSVYSGEYSDLEKINDPKNLVYVFYTSGSTGKPKGVQIEHTSIVNQIYGLEKRYSFNSSLRHILLAPFTFDPAVQQIFLPLTSGGTLFLVSKSTKHNLKELWEFILSNKIDIVNTVPSLMSVLLDQAGSRNGLHFRYIILAGETFSKNLYLRINEKLYVDKIINIYGPTEATINTTLYECNQKEINNSIPIGKPLMNYNVLILDDQQNLVPVGTGGEICISGVGLARGYLNNSELTKEKFVPNPFQPDQRIYKTGDLGRWLEDGNIEFLGRVDHQIKINGIRVELGEIESILNQHLKIKESVVISQKDSAGVTRLIAYIIPIENQNLINEDLRNFLKERLPDYMVPSTFVFLDEFPVTSHGKVDRNALPDPEQININFDSNYIPPSNEIENQLTKIWEKVLGIEKIGVKDNYFDIGGTSLMAMILFSEIEKVFGKNLPLATIIDSPNIEKLSKIISNDNWSDAWSPLVAIQTEGSKPPFFCLHGHRGNVIGFQDLARKMGSDQPFYGLQAEGLDGKPIKESSITEMAEKYVREILKVQPVGPYYLGGWCMGGTLAYEMAQILEAAGKKVALVAMIETNVCTNYPKRLADDTFFRHAFHKIFDRLKYEISIHRTLTNKERLKYLWRKTQARFIKIQVKVENLLDPFLKKFNIKLPHSWSFKQSNLVDMHEKAIVNYKAKPYFGTVAIFRANNQPLGVYPDPSLGWGELIKGKLILEEFPGHHLNTFIEPSVKDLAKKMNEAISKAGQEL